METKFSVILTKINKVNLSFKDQIGLKVNNQDPRLKEFVEYIFKKTTTDFINHPDGSIEVFTIKGHYIFKSFGNYFKRLEAQTGNKIFYRVS